MKSLLRNILIIIFSIFAIQANAANISQANSLIEGLGNSINKIISKKNLDEKTKMQQIVVELDNIIDAEWMARFVLGKHFKTLNKDQQQNFIKIYREYLVKIYAWRTMFYPDTGFINWLIAPTGLSSPGFGIFAVIIGLTYLWLPYMILPIYAGMEKLPNSILDASSDLGAKSARTFFSVILPITWPAIIAGSIFTFSLSMGDYITVQILGGTFQMLGNVVYQNFSLNLPFAAAVALIPVIIMMVYLSSIRKTGALDNL